MKYLFLTTLFTLITFSTYSQDIIFVDIDATGADNGSSWEDAYTDLQDALDLADADTLRSTIWVAEGIYLPTKDLNGNANPILPKTKVFSFIRDGIKLFGGFNGTETCLEERKLDTQQSILSGDIGTPNNNNDNTSNIMNIGADQADSLTSQTQLDGFVIEGANNISTGGAIVISANSGDILNPSITNCIFRNNNAGGGAAILNVATANIGNPEPIQVAPSITNCVFHDNSSRSIFTNRFTQLPDTSRLGVVRNFSTTSVGSPITINPVFTNCTFSNNLGGAIINPGGPFAGNNIATLNNCILWNNGDIEVLGLPTNPPTTLNFCILDDGSPDGNVTLPVNVVGSNNLDSDPLFVDAANNDFQLQNGSPAINSGNTAANTTITDVIGNIRVTQNEIDRGAFESNSMPLSPIIFVDIDATGNNDGTSWANAFTDLQDAIDKASNGCSDSIWIAEGIYTNTQSLNSYELNKDGVKLFGGFDATETSFNQRNIEQNKTILSKNNTTGRLLFINPSVGNPITPNTEINGITFQEVLFSGNGRDAAISFNASSIEISPIITNCIFRNISGNCILIRSPTLQTVNAGPVIEFCTFEDNTGRYCIEFQRNPGVISPRIEACIFRNNAINAVFTAPISISVVGGDNLAVDCIISNCLFYDNNGFGSIIQRVGSSMSGDVTVVNSTFTQNTVTDEIILNRFASDTSNFNFNIQNCIFWDNDTPTSVSNEEGASSRVNFSIIDDGTQDGVVTLPAGSTGSNNLDSDPLFFDAVNGDYNLQFCSPAIDAGDNVAIDTFTTDLAGNTRIINNIVDMGAFEKQDLTLPDVLGIVSIQTSDSLFSGAYTVQTVGSITVATMDTIIFEGTSAVILKAGFSAVAGSNFTARIGQCGVPASNNMFAPEVVEQRSEPSEVEVAKITNPAFIEKQNSLTAYPNPFRSTTTIEFELGSASNVQLSIFDLQGRIIKQVYQGTWLNAGQHQVEVEAMDWQAGIYLMQLQTEQEVIIKQLILQR